VRVALTKVDGVQSVTVSLEKAAADIQLRPGNRVTLAQLRQIIRDNGFVPKEANVTVIGTLVERGGKPALDVANLGMVWMLAADAKQRDAYAAAVRMLAVLPPGSVEVVGTLPASTGSGPEEIAVQAIRRVSQ
jgi:copper chaperone CopZ